MALVSASGEAAEAVEAVEAVVALGANLGDRERTLREAVTALGALPGTSVVAVSEPVETDPVGGPHQPDYLNAVAVLTTSSSPGELLDALHRIEADHGRERVVRWGARTLDLDLIAYGRGGSPSEVVSDDPELTLPHPRAHTRAFVLVPWSRAQPDARLRLPDGEVADVVELAARAPDRDGVRDVVGWAPW